MKWKCEVIKYGYVWVEANTDIDAYIKGKQQIKDEIFIGEAFIHNVEEVKENG